MKYSQSILSISVYRNLYNQTNHEEKVGDIIFKVNSMIDDADVIKIIKINGRCTDEDQIR